MARYAIAVATNKGYMPGVNALLNAREVYGIDADVYVYQYPPDFLDSGYKKQFGRDTFFYNVNLDWHPARINGPDPRKHWYFHCTVGMFNTIRDELLGRYRVVLYIGSDVLVMNDLTGWFQVADKLDRLVTGVVRTGPATFRRLSKEWPYHPTWEVPYNDVPVFIPNTYDDVLKTMVEYFEKPDCKLRAMDSLNYAIRDTYTEPFCHPDQVMFMKLLNSQKFEYLLEDKKPFMCCGPWRFGLAHHRPWNKARMHHARKEFSRTQIGWVNSTVVNRIYHELNVNYRVKWTEEIELWTKQDEINWRNTHS